MSKLIIPIFNHTTHKRLWMWLFRNPGASKFAWPGWEDYNRTIHGCEACRYAVQEFSRVELKRSILEIEEVWEIWNTFEACRYCPFGAQEKSCFPLYDQWRTAYTPQEQSAAALKISQLPIRADMRVKVK